MDVLNGPGVDVVVQDSYDWKELEDQSFDLVISGQCLEHVEYPWLTMEQIAKKVKPSGMVCIIVPSQGGIHRFPIDCYRYKPDGLLALGKWLGMTSVYMRHEVEEHWGDLMMVYRILTVENIPL